MGYLKPELFLVGAAQGLVLGTKPDFAAELDNLGGGGNTSGEPEISRDNPR